MGCGGSAETQWLSRAYDDYHHLLSLPQATARQCCGSSRRERRPVGARRVPRSSVAVLRRGRNVSPVPRSLVSAVASPAAVSAIVAIASGLFSGMFLQPGGSAWPSIAAPTAEIAPGSQAHFVDIQMVTPTEGWAVGYRAMVIQRQSKPLLAHVANGR